MASLPISSVIEQSRVSPPPGTLVDRSLPLTFFDIEFLFRPPIHTLLFYELSLVKSQFVETIVPGLKHSLSTTLQHFFPFVGNLIVFPTCTKTPEIRYVVGDSVKVTFAECNLDFNDLTGNHPRNCDKFYHLIPQSGHYAKVSDYLKIPVFSLQVTFFPNRGISIGMTTHHCLVDASSLHCFLKAWACISRCGTDESFLSNGTLPIYERLVKYPKLDEIYLKRVKVETLSQGYQPPRLSGPSDKVRATFVLTQKVIHCMKKRVSTQLPTLPYVSSFTVACAYIWSCIAKARNDDLELFGIPLDCRARMDPPIPVAYFGNCVWACITIAKTSLLTGNEGFITAAKLIGENLHKVLTDKDGIVKEKGPMGDSFSDKMPTTIIGISGTPKHKLYEMDFGWGTPKKHEKISIDYGRSISIDAGKESNQDLEFGICLTATEMQAFVPFFKQGLKSYV